MSEKVFQSLLEFDKAARSLWQSRGLAAVIEADRWMPDGYLVGFTVHVDRSLPPREANRLRAERERAAFPQWKLRALELDALLEGRSDACAAPVIRIELIKGQGAVGEWSLSIDGRPVGYDLELAGLFSKLAGTSD